MNKWKAYINLNWNAQTTYQEYRLKHSIQSFKNAIQNIKSNHYKHNNNTWTLNSMLAVAVFLCLKFYFIFILNRSQMWCIGKTMWKIENISLCEYLDSMCNVVDTEQRYNTSISLYNLCNTGWLFIDTKSFERRWQEHQYSRGKKTKSLFYMNRWNSFRMWYEGGYIHRRNNIYIE